MRSLSDDYGRAALFTFEVVSSDNVKMSDFPQVSERLRRAEARADTPNPNDPGYTLEAFKTVLRYTLTEVFGLVGEETLWVGYHLDQIMSPLEGKTPVMVPLAVRQEMLEGVYSRSLDGVESGRRLSIPMAADPSVRTASVSDWANVIMSMVKRSYSLRPLVEASMTGQITGLLKELGVGDPNSPRASLYIPIDVRERLASRHNG